MTVAQAIILGIIQGLTEFLPVSSSAHLFLAPRLLGWSGDGFGLAFDVALHVGTLIAVLWYFRRDWLDIGLAFLNSARTRRVNSPDEWRAVFLIIALIPALVAGLLLEDLAESVFRMEVVTAWALIILGIVLWVADRYSPGTRRLDSMRPRDALLIGLAQTLALVPGVSRSGATMTAGRMLAFDRSSAARFSFLMSMPVIAAAAVHKVPDAIASQGGVTMQLAAGTIASAVTGWLEIGFLLRFLTVRGFGFFALYRILLGVIVLIVLQ
jgi:undecaprenyl-diphosphatase